MVDLKKLSYRIKKNEGFSNIVYNDILGNQTIGYGHLVKKNEKFKKNKKYKKFFLNNIFKKDLNKAIKIYNEIFKEFVFPPNVTEVLIEMIFQLGKKRFLTFKKMIKALKKQDYILASKEMENSLWKKQTPKRALKLSKTLIGKK